MMTDKERKSVVAEEVRNALEHHALLKIARRFDDVREVSVTFPTPLQAQVRVATRDRGTHYYLVKISEAY